MFRCSGVWVFGCSGVLAQVAILAQACLCSRGTGEIFSVVCAKTFSHGQEGVDQSGSPRRLAASDSWQASTVRAAATCRISAACSSEWGSQHRSRETRRRRVCRQPSARQQQARGSTGSKLHWELFSQRTKRSGRRCSPRWRRPNDEAEVPMEQQIHATEEYLARARNASCNTMRRLLLPERRCKKPNTTKKSMCKVSPTGKTLRKLKTQAADPTLPTLPIAWRSGLAPASGRGFATTVAATSVVPTQGVSAVTSSTSPFRIRKREDYVPATEHEVLEWMADRQEETTATLMARNPTEAARISSLITDATRSVQPESVPPSMVTNMVR